MSSAPDPLSTIDPPASTVRRRRRTRTKRAQLILGSLVFALALGELFVRMGVSEQPMVRFQQFDEVLSEDPRHQFIGLCESDPDLFWRLTPNVVMGLKERPFFGLISNAEGLREDHEIRRPKPARQIRILFLGDSCTFGYLLSPESTVAEQVEVLLRSTFPSADIECINAGVPGYTCFKAFDIWNQQERGTSRTWFW